MTGTSNSAKKAWETKRKKYGKDYGKKTASHAGKHSSGGFASEKVGKDGLTGHERAIISGRKGGQNTPNNFKHDPERAKCLSQEYWNRKQNTQKSKISEST